MLHVRVDDGLQQEVGLSSIKKGQYQGAEVGSS